MIGPGIHDGIPEDVYFADDALSASGAKVLLRNPARFQWERANPPAPKDAFDVGHAAHSLILGVGQPFKPVDASDWRTKAAQAERDTIRAEGAIPLLRKDFDAVHGMAAAIDQHKLARSVLTNGKPEQTVVWLDEPTGVRLRARVDWLRPNAVADLKTARDGNPSGFDRDAANYGYHVSAAHYVAGVEARTGERLPFVLVVVEKDAPHFVSVHQFDDDFLDIGARQMRRATDLFAECTATGVWPGYSETDINLLSPPRWLT